MSEKKLTLNVDTNAEKVRQEWSDLIGFIKKNSKIELDLKNSTSEIKKLKSSIESLNQIDVKAFDKINKELEKFSKTISSLNKIKGEGFKNINTQIKSLSSTMKELSKIDKSKFGNINAQMKDMSENLQKLNTYKFNNLEQLEALSKGFGKAINDSSSKSIKNFNELTKSIDKSVKVLTRLSSYSTKDINKLGKLIEGVGTSFDKAFAGDGSNLTLKRLTEVRKSLEEINKLDAKTRKAIMNAGSQTASSGSEKTKANTKEVNRLLNEELRIRKQIAKTTNSSSLASLKGSNQLGFVQNALKQYNSSFEQSEKHMRDWQRFCANEFNSITKKAQTMGTTVSNALKFKGISGTGKENQLRELIANINQLKGMSVNLQGKGILDENELQLLTSMMNKLEQEMRGLNIDIKGVEKFDKIQSEVKDLDRLLDNLKTNKAGNLQFAGMDNLQKAKDLIRQIQNIDYTKLEGNSSAWDGVIADLQRVKELTNDYRTALNNATNTNNFAQKLNGELQKLQQMKIRFQGVEGAERQINQLEQEFHQLRNAVGTVDDQNSLQNLTNQTRTLNNELDRTQRQTTRVNRNSHGLISNLSNAMSTYTPIYMMSRAITTAMQGTAKSIIDMDSAFRDLQKVAPASFQGLPEQVDALRVKASQAGQEVATTTVDMINATASALQLGIKDMDKALEYGKNVNMFSNVSDQSVKDADKQLKSILSAYGGVTKAVKPMSAELEGASSSYTKMTEVMDLANYAGNNYAVTAGDMTKALSKFASVSQMNGTSISESMAMIIGAQESVQNADKVGTAIKAMSVNLTGLKTSAEDGSIKLNKTELALNRIGLTCLDANGQVKSTYEILNDLGKVWDGLDSRDQNSIAEAIGGKHHINTLTAMMDNWKTVVKYQSEYNSGMMVGSSMKENERYIDSIEGKITKLKDNLTRLVTTVIKTDMFKNLLDGVNKFIDGLIKGVEVLDKMGLSIPTLIGGYVGMSTLLKGLGSDTGNVVSYFTKLKGLGNVFGGLLGRGGASGVTQSVNQVNASLGTMASSTVMAGLKTSLLNAGLVTLATVGIMGVTKAIVDYENRYKNMAKEARAQQEILKEDIGNRENQVTSLGKLSKEYDKLSNKTNLTTKEQARLKDLTAQIAEIAPDLVIGHDADNQPILSLNGSLDGTIDRLKESIELKNRLLRLENQKESKANTEMSNETFDNLTRSADDYKGSLQKLSDQYGGLGEMSGKFGDTALSVFDKLTTNKVKGALTSLGGEMDLSSLDNYRDYLNKREKMYLEHNTKLTEANEEYQYQSAQIMSTQMQKVFDSKEYTDMNKKVQKQVGQLGKMMNWGNLDNSQQIKFVNGLQSIDKNVEKSGFKIEDFQTKISNLHKDYDTGSISQDKYNNMLQNYAKDLEKVTGMDWTLLVEGLKQLPQAYQQADYELGNFLKNFNSKFSELGKGGKADFLKEQFDGVSDAIAQIMAEQEVDGTINIQTLTNIVNQDELYESLPQQIQGMIDSIMGDGKVNEQEIELLMKVMANYQETGEIDKESLDKLIEMGEKGGTLTPEIKAKLSADVDDDYKKYIKDNISENKNGKVVETKVKAIFEKQGDEEVAKMLSKNGLEADSKEGKELVTKITAKYEAQGEEVMNNVAGVMMKLGLEGKQQSSFLAQVKAKMESEGFDISKFKSVQDIMTWLRANPKIQNKIGIELTGQDALKKLKKDIDEVSKGATKEDQKIIKKISAKVEKGDIESATKELSKIKNQKVKVDIQGKMDDQLKGLDKQFSKEIKQDVKVTDNQSGRATMGSMKQVANYANSSKPKQNVKITDNQTGRATLGSLKEVAGYATSHSPSMTVWVNFQSKGDSKAKQAWGGGSLTQPYDIVDTPMINVPSIAPQAFTNAVVGATPDSALSITPKVNVQPRFVGGFGMQSQASFGGLISAQPHIYKFVKSSKDMLTMINYSINAFYKLDYSLKRVQNSYDLLSVKMEKAVGKGKLYYLEKSISYMQQEQKIYKKQFEYYKKERSVLKARLKKGGFEFDDQGNIKDYEKQLLSMERKLKSYESKANKKKASKSTKNRYEAYQKDYEHLKNYVEEYTSLTQEKIPEAEQAWYDCANAIKEAKDEIERIKFEDRFYKFANSVTDSNHQLDILQSKITRVQGKLEHAVGAERLTLLKEEISLTQQSIKLQEKKIEDYKKQRKEYRYKLRDYGAKFDKDGQITNYDDVLNKYQNSKDKEKVKELLEEFVNLGNEMNGSRDELRNLRNELEELSTNVKLEALELGMKGYNDEIAKATDNIKGLTSKLDIIESKMQHAFGQEKLKLINQQIQYYQQLINKQKDVLTSNKNMEADYIKKLKDMGAQFNGDGELSNESALLDKFANKGDGNYSYVQKLLEDWKKLHYEEIPNAEKEVINYENAIKDAYKSQLDTTKQMEDEITKVYKDQIEKRKKAIEEETETVKKALEKQRQAYKDMREEVEFKDEKAEKETKIADLERQIETAKLDNTLGGRKRLAELQKQLADAKKDMDKFMNDKIDKDVDKVYQDQIDKAEEESNKRLEDLEKTWTDNKIAEMVSQALGSGVFTDIDGKVSSLKDTMLSFTQQSADAFSVMGDTIEKELIGNLDIAMQTMKDYETIMNGINKELSIGGLKGGGTSSIDNSRTVTIGEVVLKGTTEAMTQSQLKQLMIDTMKEIVQTV